MKHERNNTFLSCSIQQMPRTLDELHIFDDKQLENMLYWLALIAP